MDLVKRLLAILVSLPASGGAVRRGIAAGGFCVLLAVAAGADTGKAGYDRVFGEIGDTIEKHFYDATFVREKFGDIRRRYAAKAARARSRAQFAALVNAMLAELKSSHTQYYTSDDSAYYQLASIFRAHPNLKTIVQEKPLLYPSLGIETGRRGGRVFVITVLEGGPAEKAGILKGDEILSIDRRPFLQVASLREGGEKAFQISVRRRAGAAPVTVAVTPAMVDPKEEYLAAERASVRLFEAGTKKIGYIHILSYANEDFHNEFLDALAGPLKNADALIWDLRDGWGGADPGYLNVFNTKVPVLSMTGRDGSENTYDPQWRKPVVMLVNGRVRSGKEVLAGAFRKYGTGTVIGERTAGAVLAGTPFALSDGSILYLAVGGVRVDGDVLEGKGVEPDIAVPMNIEYLEGRDVQLQKAREYLEAKLKPAE